MPGDPVPQGRQPRPPIMPVAGGLPSLAGLLLPPTNKSQHSRAGLLSVVPTGLASNGVFLPSLNLQSGRMAPSNITRFSFLLVGKRPIGTPNEHSAIPAYGV